MMVIDKGVYYHGESGPPGAAMWRQKGKRATVGAEGGVAH
jgi:hypothetical protein